jgi:hypothetical protein
MNAQETMEPPQFFFTYEQIKGHPSRVYLSLVPVYRAMFERPCN